jgi:integrase
MPSTKLTALGLERLAEGDHPDHIRQGLVLRVGRRRRTWTQRYFTSGKFQRETLGYFLGYNIPGSMGLADAREAARALMERVEAGVPIKESKPSHPRTSGTTVSDMLDQYEQYRREKGKRIRSLDKSMRYLRTNLSDYLDLSAKAFSKDDLRKVRDTIHKRAPHQASAFLRYLGPVMKWAADEDIIDNNFAPTVRKRQGINKRTRVLDLDEVRALWKATFELERVGKGPSAKTYSRLLRFLLLTSARLDEAASLRHGNILDGIWRVDEHKTSETAAVPHRLRLPQLVLDQIGIGGARDLCFPGEGLVAGGKKLSGWSYLKRQIDALIEIPHWTVHDLRRTSATQMRELGVPLDVIDAVQAHALTGTKSHYIHALLERPKAEALSLWADALEDIIAGRQPRQRWQAAA